MNYTENYQLCRWEASDPIRREDFNADNARLDAAILAVKNQVETVAAANCLVKLAEVTTTETVNQINLDLSGCDMTKFQALELYVDGAASPQGNGIYCAVNGDRSTSYMANTTTASYIYLTQVPMNPGRGGCSCRIFSNGQHVCFSGHAFWANSSDAGVGWAQNYGAYKNHTLADVTMLTLFSESYPYLSGFHAVLYGIAR